jgi:hypothetical protein
VDKVELGQVFSEYFGCPCQFSLHKLFQIHLSSRAGTVGQIVANVPRGLSLTLPHEIKEKNYTGFNHDMCNEIYLEIILYSIYIK